MILTSSTARFVRWRVLNHISDTTLPCRPSIQLDTLIFGQHRIEKTGHRIESKIDDIFKAVIGLANDEHKYPALFYLIPAPKRDKKGLSYWLTKPNELLNEELMIVFVCARTKRCVKYGDEDGLTFTVPKEGVAGVLRKVTDFWERFGPILKISAALLTTASRVTTGVRLDELVPKGLVDSIARAGELATFASEYATRIEEIVDAGCAVAGVEHATLESVKPADGVDGIDTKDREQLSALTGPAFLEFGKFLEAVAFDRRKLDMEVAIVEGMGMQWVAREEDGMQETHAELQKRGVLECCLGCRRAR